MCVITGALYNISNLLRRIGMKKIGKYGIFGVITAGLEFVIFMVLSMWIHIYAASALSFLVGLVTSFVFNKFVVFKNSKKVARCEIVQFFALGLVNSQLSSFMTFIASMIMPKSVAKILSMGAIATWNYVLMNFIIFKKDVSKNT